MRKTATFIALAALLAGCASTVPVYGNQLSWRPKNSNAAPYVITSRLDSNVWDGSNILHLFVDGEEVITGPLSPINNSGSFVGMYKGHKVSVDCKQASAEILCDTFMDSEKVGTF